MAETYQFVARNNIYSLLQDLASNVAIFNFLIARAVPADSLQQISFITPLATH